MGSTTGSTVTLHLMHQVSTARVPSRSTETGKRAVPARHPGHTRLLAAASQARACSHEHSLSPTLDTNPPSPWRASMVRPVPLHIVKTACHADGLMFVIVTLPSDPAVPNPGARPAIRCAMLSGGPLTTRVSGTPHSRSGLCRLGACGRRSR